MCVCSCVCMCASVCVFGCLQVCVCMCMSVYVHMCLYASLCERDKEASSVFSVSLKSSHWIMRAAGPEMASLQLPLLPLSYVLPSLLAFDIHRGHYLTFLPGACVQCSEHQSRLPEMIVSEAREYHFSSSCHCLGECTTELPFQVLLLDRSETLLPPPRELRSEYGVFL